MTLRYRQILFWASSLFFLIVALPILLYSFGYRLSKSPLAIVRTGGLFVSSIPSREAQIYINEKLRRETGTFSRSIFLQSLTPGTYNVKILRDGFRVWEKNIPVEPELVTEIQALLIKDPVDGTILHRGNFTAIEQWNDTTLKLITEKNEERFFNMATLEFVSRSDIQDSAISPEASTAVEQIVLRERPDGYAVGEKNDKILWWDGRTIWVEWFENSLLPPYTKEQTIKIFEGDRPIEKALFYPEREAVIAVYRGEIIVIELDGRGGHLTTPLYKGKAPAMLLPYADEQILYILDNGILIRAELT